MCNKCDKVVLEMDIRESDLPNMPYTLVKWSCMIPGCKGGARHRDYGITPFFFDPVKRRTNKLGFWRGGWFNAAEHFYICGRHAKDADRMVEAMKHRFSAEFFLSKIIPVTITKSKQKKPIWNQT